MKYDNGILSMSVGELCEAACRGGDLDSRSPVSYERMAEGTKIHRELQANRGENFTAEVRLTNTSDFSEIKWCVSGIADGVTDSGGKLLVEEIKTVTRYAYSQPPEPAHLAQLRTYAHFICEERGLTGISLRLIRYNIDSGKSKNQDFYLTADELRLYYQSLLSAAIRRARQFVSRQTVTIPSVRELAVFPYGGLRPGQDELITGCYRAIKQRHRLFAQAPTGIGKTVSALYPAARALGDGLCDRIFYLTAKSSTRREAYGAAKALFESGAHLRTCVISAKEQMCSNQTAKLGNQRGVNLCNPDDCEFARGYYDRADDAIFDLLGRCNGYSRQVISDTAKKFNICPYEFSLDLSEFCDILICDYNYAFDPAVYLRRYFAQGVTSGNNVFLVDEAHNLPDRARDMYSAELNRRDFEAVYAKVPEEDSVLDGVLKGIILSMRGLRKLCRDNLVNAPDGERGFWMSRQALPGFPDKLLAFVGEAERWLHPRRGHPLYGEVSALVTAARRYLRICEYYDDKFLTYVEIFGGNTRVRIFCLDPSGVLGARLDRACSAVMFSATLTPLDYFTELLGGGKTSETLNLPSPFPPERLCIAAVDSVSTRSDDRDERNCRKVASLIAATVSVKAGNYICYFPSYDYMEKVEAAFTRKYPRVTVVTQRRGMNWSERENFLAAFKDDTGILRVGFCVLGGSFSEGVDLPGSRLIGSIVVGVGIPGLSNERNIIRDYYDETNGEGYDYAYTYPGMNAVLQAAGRVIRRDNDCGIVVLIDDRYASGQYLRLFPEHWSHLQYAGNPTSLAELSRRFWEKIKI